MWSKPWNGWIANVAFIGVVASVSSAAAQDIAADCAVRQNVLGVSRVIEVDTTGGPRFGNMQYKEIDFLKEGEVVLTFDDGPLRRYSTAVLNALEAECTKAMFFMTGRMAVTDPHTVREIDRRGHTIATHSWSHKNEGRLSRARAEKEVELGFSAVSAALGRPVAPFFRFPYLSDPKSMIAHMKSRDISIFSIDVDSKDFRTRSGPAMVNRVMLGLKRQGKGILLFHDIQRSTAKGIRALLRKLKRNGFKVVHMVAKAPVTTLPKYDVMAAKELARRKKAWSTRPFPAKSIPWPVSNGGLPAKEPLTVIQKPVKQVVVPELPPRKGGGGGVGRSGISVPPSSLSNAVTSQGDGARARRRVRSAGARARTVKPGQTAPPTFRPPVDSLQQRIYSD